jgi:hypothetical protein
MQKFDIGIPKWVTEVAKKKDRRYIRYRIESANTNGTQIKITWQSLSKRGWKDMTPPDERA